MRGIMLFQNYYCLSSAEQNIYILKNIFSTEENMAL